MNYLLVPILLLTLLLLLFGTFFIVKQRGHEFIKEAYAEAVKERYKFYTYGDAMLII